MDPTTLADWQIAEAAEESMLPFAALGDRLGLTDDEMIPHGRRLGRVDHRKVLQRLGGTPRAKYVDVTAITPPHSARGRPPPPSA